MIRRETCCIFLKSRIWNYVTTNFFLKIAFVLDKWSFLCVHITSASYICLDNLVYSFYLDACCVCGSKQWRLSSHWHSWCTLWKGQSQVYCPYKGKKFVSHDINLLLTLRILYKGICWYVDSCPYKTLNIWSVPRPHLALSRSQSSPFPGSMKTSTGYMTPWLRQRNMLGSSWVRLLSLIVYYTLTPFNLNREPFISCWTSIDSSSAPKAWLWEPKREDAQTGGRWSHHDQGRVH